MYLTYSHQGCCLEMGWSSLISICWLKLLATKKFLGIILPFFLKKTFIFIIFVYMVCMCVCVCPVCHGSQAEVRGQLCTVCSPPTFI